MRASHDPVTSTFAIRALVPLPRRLGARAPGHTTVIPTPLLQPLLGAELQLPLQLRTGFLSVDEVAEPSSDTALSRIQSTTGLSEIRHGRKFAVDGPGGIPPAVKRVTRRLRRILVFESRINVANKMIIVIVANHHLLELAVLAHLTPKVLVEGVEVVLQLRGIHLVLRVVGRVLVQVGQEDRLRV